MAAPGQVHPELQFNTNHVFEVVDGQASVSVNDTLELRSAFLRYCNSPIRATEMHRVEKGAQLSAPNFMSLCKDLELVEPSGPISLLAVGIVFATLKSDQEEGLTYASFLDALMELAFESGRNVAGQLQSIWAAKALAPHAPAVRPPGLMHSDSSLRTRASEPGFGPQPPGALMYRASEAGVPISSGPMPSAPPDMARSLTPRFSESGRFQRSNSLFRSTPNNPFASPDGQAGVSILGSRGSGDSPQPPDGRSSSYPMSGGEGKSPRPPSALSRSGSISAQPFLRPSAAQRPLKARGALGAGGGDDGCPEDGSSNNGDDGMRHPLHATVMGGWPQGAPQAPQQQRSRGDTPPQKSPLSRLSAMFQVDDGEDDDEGPAPAPPPKTPASPAVASSLSRVSAMFAAPDAQDEPDGLFAPSVPETGPAFGLMEETATAPKRPASASRQSMTGAPQRPPSASRVSVSGGAVRPPSASSPLGRQSISGSNPSRPGPR